MLLATAASLWLAWSLRTEASYALESGFGESHEPSAPIDLGELQAAGPWGASVDPHLDNRYVRASGMLGSSGAIRYGRFAEGDSFRLAPIAGNESLWVEIRVPEGFEGPRFVPPTSFAGRLVRFDEAGLRHAPLRGKVVDSTGVHVPEGAWLLVDGASPRASRWAILLVLVFSSFASWNVIGLLRMLRTIRDAAEGTTVGAETR